MLEGQRERVMQSRAEMMKSLQFYTKQTPPQTLVGSWPTLPAPRFVHLIYHNEKLLTTLPLYVAYGKAWLKTIAARERLCDCGNKSNEDENSEATQSQVLASSDEANIFLAKLCAQ
jgi:hypothetical protein